MLFVLAIENTLNWHELIGIYKSTHNLSLKLDQVGLTKRKN